MMAPSESALAESVRRAGGARRRRRRCRAGRGRTAEKLAESRVFFTVTSLPMVINVHAHVRNRM